MGAPGGGKRKPPADAVQMGLLLADQALNETPLTAELYEAEFDLDAVQDEYRYLMYFAAMRAAGFSISDEVVRAKFLNSVGGALIAGITQPQHRVRYMAYSRAMDAGPASEVAERVTDTFLGFTGGNAPPEIHLVLTMVLGCRVESIFTLVAGLAADLDLQ